jgi:hypothetical protein
MAVTKTNGKVQGNDVSRMVRQNLQWAGVWVLLMVDTASHKSSPLSVPRGIVGSYSALPWVTWEAVTVVEGITWWGLLQHMLANRALVYQAKVEGTVLKAAWHWGRDDSVINDPLGEPGRTPLYVGPPSAWGSVDSDPMFFLYVCRRAPCWGLRQTHEWINK